LTGIPSVFYLIYIPSALIAPGNATATADKIMASEALFRLGIVSELLSATSFIFVVLALYDLLRAVNRKQALLMVTLFVISVPISFVNVLNQIAVLKLLGGTGFLSVFDKAQQDALAMVFVGVHGYGVIIAQIFWGLWLAPFGMLVFRSGFIPPILGILLMISCVSYVAASITVLLFPSAHMVSEYMMGPAGFGELAIILWLLIKGARAQPSADPA
jgi:hypothetical protein